MSIRFNLSSAAIVARSLISQLGNFSIDSEVRVRVRTRTAEIAYSASQA